MRMHAEATPLPLGSPRAGDVASGPARTDLARTLYDEHADFAYRCVRGLGVPEADAEDAVQEVFLVVHRRIADYQPGTLPRAWIFQIAYRVAQTLRRRMGTRLPASVDPDQLPSSARDPLATTLGSERRAILYELIAALDEPYRAPFLLIEVEEMSLEDTALALSLTRRTVKWRIFRARRQFASLLEKRLRDRSDR